MSESKIIPYKSIIQWQTDLNILRCLEKVYTHIIGIVTIVLTFFNNNNLMKYNV
jgi:hypothetical protein